MVDHNLETPRLVVFGVKCLNCDTAKFSLRNNPAWKQRPYRSRHLIPMSIGPPCSIYFNIVSVTEIVIQDKSYYIFTYYSIGY